MCIHCGIVSIALAKATGSSGGTSHPCTPSSISDRLPSTEVATIGQLAAIAGFERFEIAYGIEELQDGQIAAWVGGVDVRIASLAAW